MKTVRPIGRGEGGKFPALFVYVSLEKGMMEVGLEHQWLFFEAGERSELRGDVSLAVVTAQKIALGEGVGVALHLVDDG